jgi:ATPase family associated with various cellular activities (AAA)
MMSSTLAEKRVNDFKNKYGEVALQLAYHAALPVALNADLLHLLRINFFLDPPAALSYTAEFELLLSPLCREIDEGLYEIEPEIRDILLQGLCSINRGQRIKDVATLLWQYIDRDAVWIDRVELERAQQLTVLNFLDPAQAKEYLAEGDAAIDDGEIAERDWYVAMRQEIDQLPALQLRDQAQSFSSGKIYSNLPPRGPFKFINREREIQRLLELISTSHRSFIHIVQGRPGAGKTSLALEVAHRCLDARQGKIIDLNVPEFDAFIFVSSKIQYILATTEIQRPERDLTLIDVLQVISEVLEERQISQLPIEHQKQEVCKTLLKQSVLLIIDDLERLSKEEIDKVLEFLNEIPYTTEVIGTSQRSFSSYNSILLTGLERLEVNELIHKELKTKATKKKQVNASKIRKIQENIFILRNSRSTDAEKISALKELGRAIDNEQAIQAILFLTRTSKNNDVIAEAAKSLGNIGKKDISVLQEMIRLLRSSSNNLVIIEILTSLGKIGNTDSTTVRAVLNLLTFNKNGSVIINIMKAFALIAKGNNEVIQKILSLLPNNNDTNVKKSMIESLGEIASGNKIAINQLISILRFSPNAPILRQFAANGLGKIALGDKDAISAMESELKFSSIKAVKDRVAVNLNKIDRDNKAAADYRVKTKKTRSTKK